MSKHILITRKIPDIAEKMLRERGYAVDANDNGKSIASLLKKKQYDAVLCLLTDKIDGKALDLAPSTKIFANYATGFDNIDLEAARAHGITVTNAPAPETPESVAEHTFALALSVAKRVVEGDKFVRAGKYKEWMPLAFLGTDLAGKTFGIVGTGRIGARVAEMARAVGLKVIYTDVNRNAALEEKCQAEYFPTVNEMLPKADFVSLHVPLLPSTRHLLNAENLRLMKPTAFLINTSRGPVVDEWALIRALEEKIIAGAGLDVYEFEPKIPKSLRKLPNTVLTPHIASASSLVREQMAQIAAQNIIDFFEGKKPKYAVV